MVQWDVIRCIGQLSMFHNSPCQPTILRCLKSQYSFHLQWCAWYVAYFLSGDNTNLLLFISLSIALFFTSSSFAISIGSIKEGSNGCSSSPILFDYNKNKKEWRLMANWRYMSLNLVWKSFTQSTNIFLPCRLNWIWLIGIVETGYESFQWDPINNKEVL